MRITLLGTTACADYLDKESFDIILLNRFGKTLN